MCHAIGPPCCEIAKLVIKSQDDELTSKYILFSMSLIL